MTSTDMKISKTTLSILKNFAGMNSNILIKPGNVIKTITPSRSGMAEAVIEETFDVEFGIWDLNKFLGVVSLFSNPVFEFGEKSVKIYGSQSGSNSVVNYFYSEPRLLTYPNKNVNMPPTTVKTMMEEGMFDDLSRISSVLQLPDISFRSEGTTINAIVTDLKDPTSNSYTVELEGNADGAEFELNFKMENIRVFPGDYEISFAKNIAAQFSNQNIELNYWFAMEPNSRYTE